MDFNNLPRDEIIIKTVAALEKNGMSAKVVDNREAAKQAVLSLLPKGAEVMDMTSETLNQIGFTAIIQQSGDYIFARKNSYELNQQTQSKEIHNLRSIPTWAIGSVHAVTEQGEIMVASQSGSQLAAYVYGSDHIIWVIGAQKIVENRELAFRRIYEHCLPLESVRAHKAYGVEKSAVNKIFILSQEINKERIKIILVKEKLGF